MNQRIPILDHGYLEVVEHYGSDERVVEAARMSTGKGFLGWGERHVYTCPHCHEVRVLTEECFDPVICLNDAGRGDHGLPMSHKTQPGDEKLLAFLYTHEHATPFEMAGAVIEVQAPIFVFREWHRHRTQSYNEMSARYTPLPDVNYTPSVERCMSGNVATSNKQAQRVGSIDTREADARAWLINLEHSYRTAQQAYEHGLAIGLPKEVARVCLPVGRYSRMRASTNLRNWLAFLTLRHSPAAQWEIRQYAEALAVELRRLFPRTMQLWDEYETAVIPRRTGDAAADVVAMLERLRQLHAGRISVSLDQGVVIVDPTTDPQLAVRGGTTITIRINGGA